MYFGLLHNLCFQIYYANKYIDTYYVYIYYIYIILYINYILYIHIYTPGTHFKEMKSAQIVYCIYVTEGTSLSPTFWASVFSVPSWWVASSHCRRHCATATADIERTSNVEPSVSCCCWRGNVLRGRRCVRRFHIAGIVASALVALGALSCTVSQRGRAKQAACAQHRRRFQCWGGTHKK